MDMGDIPFADELEWLESHSLFPEHDDEDMQDFYPPQEEEEEEEEEEQQGKSLPQFTSVVSSCKRIESKKRPWKQSDSSRNEAATSEEKRNRLSSPSREMDDEDWLRYSPKHDNVEVAPVDVVEEEKYLSRFATEIDGDCVPVTGPCGNRVFAKMSSVENANVKEKLSVKAHYNGIMPEPINILMEKMEKETLAKALAASCESTGDLMHPENVMVGEQLWVEKYAPKSFTELLSNEQTNREVLLWLKQWDSCVFGSEIRSTADDILSSLRRHSSICVSQHQKLSDKSFVSKSRKAPHTIGSLKHSDNLDQETNNLKSISEPLNKKLRGTGPPDQKILLLSGAPGLGKTTLAHIAAKHCGYHVVEINASDDRSSSTIEAKILDIMQMNSIMVDSKPKCLVIDEIDGALGEGKGAVEVILKMVAAEKKLGVRKSNVAQEEHPGQIKSKNQHRAATLSRPVICICNDLFAPALRPLRQVAKVHIFMQPTVNRVVSRLKYICSKEGFKASSVALTTLAEYTECDIRSCLNTLQFLNKKKEAINVLEISSQIVGRKDMSRSVFDVWKEVFQTRKMRRERKAMNGCSTMSSDFDVLHSLVSNCGDYELITDGIHENILQLHYHDPLMQKTVNCLNILGASDHLHQYIMRTQQQLLIVYQPYTAIATHYLIAQIGRPNIEWPRSFQRFRTMFMEKKDLLKCWNNQISPLISRHRSPNSIVEDVISPLLHILSPQKLRPVALHLQSEGEKHDLVQLVETMTTYSVTYKNAKLEPSPSVPKYEAGLDASTLVLDPPIDEFVNFKSHTSEHFGLSFAMKQVLVHEVERRKIHQESSDRLVSSIDTSKVEYEALFGKNGKAALSETKTKTTFSQQRCEVVEDKLNSRHGPANISTSMSDSKGGSLVSTKENASGVAKKRSGGSSCFFDRFRKVGGKGSLDSDNPLQKAATLERDSRPLLFKFNEGFTNAVKRPVRIRDLL